jgi:hypothetical protein
VNVVMPLAARNEKKAGATLGRRQYRYAQPTSIRIDHVQVTVQSESDVLTYLASATWDLIRSVVILAVLSAAIFRAVLDFGGRAIVQRWWIERWLNSAAVEALNQEKSAAGLYSLDYRQLCAQLSAATQFDLRERRTASPLLRAFVGPESVDDLQTLESTVSDARAQERLSQNVERQIDMLQAFLAQSMSRLTNDASVAISFGVISLLLALASPRYGELVGTTGILCLVQSVTAVADARIASSVWIRWLRLLIPALIVIALVLTLAPFIPVDLTPMLLVVISGYSGGMLSPIMLTALTRMSAQR